MRRIAVVFCLVLAVTTAPARIGYCADESAAATAELTYAQLELKGKLPEGPHLPGLFGEMTDSLDTTIARLDKAAADSNVAGVLLHINNPEIGWAKMRALRQAIGRIQAKGKKVYAWLDSASNMDYLLAAGCNEIAMPEGGVLMTVGVRAEVTFYKKLFDLVGVQADMLRVGEFKSAAEPYTRTEMSPEFRKEMEEVLGDFYNLFLTTAAESRNLSKDKVASAIDAGPLTAQAAKDLGLIDRVGYADEQEAALAVLNDGKSIKLARNYGKKKTDTDFTGLAGMMKMIELLSGVEQPRRKSGAPKIAVIHAHGMITSGKSKADFLSGAATMGSDTMIKAIREARKDETVKAIVLRVDSPGGSALASDLIWHELELVQKPFVVSMGDVAGSGGYYIAMGADRIFADPGTITGSIGVVGGKLALNGLYGKIGLTTDVISHGKNSGINSTTFAFSDSERAAMQKLLDTIYAEFTRKAAEGRKMDVSKLRELAGGRIYSGSMARKLGLIDELGTLEDAFAYAREKAGLSADDKVERLQLPKAVSPFESLFGSLDPNAQTSASDAAIGRLLGRVSPDLERNYQMLGLIGVMMSERVLAVMPFAVVVK